MYNFKTFDKNKKLVPNDIGREGCGQELDNLVADTGPPSGGEGQEVGGLDEPALLDEALGPELFRADPILPGEI